MDWSHGRGVIAWRTLHEGKAQEYSRSTLAAFSEVRSVLWLAGLGGHRLTAAAADERLPMLRQHQLGWTQVADSPLAG